MIPQIFTLDLLQLASGDCLGIQVYKFIGHQPGKKAYLQANLHGCEIVGNAVIHQLIEFLVTLELAHVEGEIWLVPVCNPLATNQRHHNFSTGRFNSYDGKDWNRIFWDYEKEGFDLADFARSQIALDIDTIRKNYLAKIKAAFSEQLTKLQAPNSLPYDQQYRYHLQSLCLDANYVIDIHSSSNQAIDYIYCFQGRESSASYFGLDYGILMNEYDGDAFDEAFLKPWLALEKQFAILGKNIKFDLESWTLELGSGMTMNPESTTKGVQGIKNYLFHKGILKIANFTHSEIVSPKINLIEKSNISKYYAPTGGMIQTRVKPGTKVEQGEKLYQLLSFNRTEKLPQVIDIHAQSSGLVFDVATNQSANQGEYVLSIFNY